MTRMPTLRAELDDQRRLIERQGIEISRQGRQLKLQLLRSAEIQVQLDRILNAVQRAEPNLRATEAVPSNGNVTGQAAPTVRPKARRHRAIE